jgi:hypothetical protein
MRVAETDASAGRTGLGDPRAVEILTAEHWGLLSTRTLGYQEMFARTTIFIAALLLPVALFIGLTTFVRCVAINYEDAHWVNGLHLLRSAYLRINPELAPFFESTHMREADDQSLAHGNRQRRELLDGMTGGGLRGIMAILGSSGNVGKGAT